MLLTEAHEIVMLMECFQMELLNSWDDAHIICEELLSIVIRAAVGQSVEPNAISCHCDNAAVVAIVHSRRSKVE